MSDATRIVAADNPEAPTGLQVIQQSSTQITISWFAVPGEDNGGSPITGYQVYWKESTDANYVIAGVTTESTLSLSKTIPTPGATY